jgi:leader peptidase (prepilin peptidase)/N-methyltransferase
MTLIEFLPVFFATGFAIQLSLIDIREMRIPNRILFPALLISTTLILVAGFIMGDLYRSLIAFSGGFLSIALFFCIHLLRPKGLGMGDVKFAGFIGLTLSWISFPSGLIGLGLAFIFSSIFSISIFVVRRKSFKKVLPFAPFMLLGLFSVELGLFI